MRRAAKRPDRLPQARLYRDVASRRDPESGAEGCNHLRETVLVEGEGVQNPMRWENYTQTAIDPTDDRTIWYVGDYMKKGVTSYSSRIGAFRLPGCGGR
jgi:hypothetical protein